MTEKIFMGVIGASIIGGISIILFCLLSWICQKRYRAKTRKIIWIVIAVCLLLPLNMIVMPYTVTVKVPNVVIKEYEGHKDTQQKILQSVPKSDYEQKVNKYMPEKEQEKSQVEITTQKIIFALWLCVSIILAVYYLAGYFLMRHKLKRWSSECQDEEVLKAIRDIASELEMKSIPEVHILEYSNQGPFTTGIIRNVVYLPDENLLENDLYYILKHEFVHCKERDILWKMLFLVVNVVHWFNPFVCIMRKLAENDLEQACDEVVLKGKSAQERREYSEIIMSWVEKSGRRTSPLATSYMAGMIFLKWRFANIFDCEQKKTGIVFVGTMCIITVLIGSIVNISWVEKTYQANKIPINSGIEVRTDLDGDGEEDTVSVTDFWSDEDAFTQVLAKAGDHKNAVINYDGYYSSMAVTGDLSGNDCSDVLLLNAVIASNYGAVEISVLHYEDGEWEVYPSNLIPNPDIEMGQPSSFEPEESWRNGELYIGATIFERDGRHLLRLISLLPDEGEEIVKCIEASYRADGWYIENVEKFGNYYSDKLCRTLLKNNY